MLRDVPDSFFDPLTLIPETIRLGHNYLSTETPERVHYTLLIINNVLVGNFKIICALGRHIKKVENFIYPTLLNMGRYSNAHCVIFIVARRYLASRISMIDDCCFYYH